MRGNSIQRQKDLSILSYAAEMGNQPAEDCAGTVAMFDRSLLKLLETGIPVESMDETNVDKEMMICSYKISIILFSRLLFWRK